MSIDFIRPEVDELRPRISVIGVGGAGGNAIANMIASRTCRASISSSPTPTRRRSTTASPTARSSSASKITQGLGAGSRPEIGKAAAEEALDEIEAGARRRPYVLHRRRHGRRHRHRRRAGHRQGGARPRHPHRRRRHQAVQLRRQSPRPRRRGRHRGAAAACRHPDRHPQPESVPHRQPEHDLQGSVP